MRSLPSRPSYPSCPVVTSGASPCGRFKDGEQHESQQGPFVTHLENEGHGKAGSGFVH